LNALREEFGKTEDLAQMGIDQVDQDKNDIQQSAGVVASSYFDLSKIGQIENTFDDSNMDLGEVDDSLANETNSQLINFNDPQELQDILDQNKQDPAFINKLVQMAPSDSQDIVKDAIQRYYEPRDIADKAIISAEIFKAIHGRGQGEESVPATFVESSVNDIVLKTNDMIKEIAIKVASANINKPFNLRKESQYHGHDFTEFINFGPESKRMLPYSNTGMLANDWHVWQRAKDHGFIFDDHAVDFDTFWRGNIMDKYSQPYRNEDGEWVGGYINKRFEVDRNVPEGNNYQLLPGQKRRPGLPEFASMESRLQANREKIKKQEDFSTIATVAKFNLKQANLKKK
jgi:hypothetical protein